MPSVSVLLPVFNAEHYLERALQSLTPDLGPDVEVIAVNDGSTDRSGELLDRWEGPRFKVIHQQNAGIVRALRTAVDHASGEFFARMDSDDLSVAGRIPTAVGLLRQDPRLALVSYWSELIGFEDEHIGTVQFAWDRRAADRAMYLENAAGGGAPVFRRASYEAVGGYRPSACEDYDLFDRLSEQDAFVIVPRIAYRYRVNIDSLSRRNAVAVVRDADGIKRNRWERRPPSTEGVVRAALHYRSTPARGWHRAHLRALAAGSRQRGDHARFVTFALAWALA